MRSKFISLILAIAVVLAMAVVPVAVPGQVAVASGNVTVAIEPSTTHVLSGGSFTIDAVVDNPSAMPVNMHGICLNFDPNYFTVDSVSLVDFTTDMGPPTINNTAGHFDYEPCLETGVNTTSTHIVSARISCTAKSLVGTSTISWVYNTTPPPRTTAVAGPTGEYLGGNMSLMFNGTVMVGTPTLTVNVTPAGKGDVKVAGVTPTGYPYNTTWSWDDVVNLEAVNSTDGWGFVNWTGDVADPNSTSTTVTMDALTKNVTANFEELDPELSVSPSSLTVPVLPNGTAYASYTITNIGGKVLNWSLSNVTYVPDGNKTWFTQNPVNGTLTANVSDIVNVTANATGLAVGTYNATINITGNSSKELPVTLIVGTPEISVSPTSLAFTTTEGENPANRTLEVWNSGTGMLNWSLTDGGTAWLSESPTSGNSTGEHDNVTVSVDASGMAAGDYSATITITDPLANNTPQTVSVSLAIAAAAEVEIPEVTEVPEIIVGPASLSASSLSITPQQVKPGQDVTISISVANTGGETGSYNAVLYINGVVEDSQSVSVAGGASKNVIFTVTKSQAGVYDVSLAGQNGQFEVVSTGWFAGGLGTGGIIAIVVIVIVLIVAVVFILRGTARPE